MNTKTRAYVFLCLAMTNLFVWNITLNNQRDSVKSLTRSFLHGIENEIQENHRENSLALVRMANRWESEGGTNEK